MKKLTLLTIMSIAAGTALMAQTLSICYGSGYTLNSKADAVAASGEVTYQWLENGEPVDDSDTPSLTVAAGKALGVYEYVRMAAGEDCPDGVPSNTFTVTVNPVPAIHTASQTVAQGTPISTIIYTASDGATISMTGSLPPGVTETVNGSSYTISGTPSATGTFGYALTSTTEEGCTSAVTAGTITVIAGPPTIPTTLCTQCCYNGTAWVDCYVTTKAYPFDNVSTNTPTAVVWSGNGLNYYSGATSDKNGRANTAAISSTGTSAVQLCKNLGTGWYLPAYEELYAMSSGSATTYSNNRDGAGILTSGNHWTSTEFVNNDGRYNTTNTGDNYSAVGIQITGVLGRGNKTAVDLVRCAWRP